MVLMDNISSVVFILFLIFFFSTQNYFKFSLGSMNIICKPSERRALLSFKQDLRDPSDSLSSWSGENCCGWAGVVCSNTTNHVVQLQLHDLGLSGELNPSLQELKQLRHLDLSLNDFDGIRIPDFLGTLPSLRYLNLKHLDLEIASSNLFHAVNMLPSLLVLRLSHCSLLGALPSLSHVNFTSLEVLDLAFNFNLDSGLPEWLYSLTNLQQLYLRNNSFESTISPSIGNLTKLTLLDLSMNQLSGEIPITLGNLFKLQRLDLSYNQLSGSLSNELERLKNLNSLSLRANSFSGPIPLSIGRLSLLKDLDLGKNNLNGSLPVSLGNLSKLVALHITKNAFEGVVSEVHFANLTNLQYLSMDSLLLKISPEWVAPFQLLDADLRTCQLGPGFPIWLRTQKNLTSLDLSKTGISGTIPTWFWNFTKSNDFSFDLSHNELNGELPKLINARAIYFSSNQFNGQLPRVTSNVGELDLSNNSFSGPISSTFLCNPISEINDLYVLDLSNNLLSGNLSDCWVYWTSLVSLRLGYNNITGKIPSSMGSLLVLQFLHLQKNNLSGDLPLSLRNCTSLRIVDIRENVLTGRLPIWLGESFPDLILLLLLRNKFYGEIPQQLCDLTSLQMLLLAHNNLSGSIPRCFNNFTAMVTNQKSGRQMLYILGKRRGVVETISVVTIGREFEYRDTFTLETGIDLSENSLSGEIPEELATLIGLQYLNLSHNRFTGKIPEKIGNMNLLECLDFSNNNISGVIPLSISNLSSLSCLDFSYNNLSGKIPSGTQMQSFNESSFTGNQELCGIPLNKCNGEEPTQRPPGDREAEDWFEMKWFYMSMGVGFAVGFWPFWVVILLKRSWRIAYFQFLDDIKDKLCLLF